MPDEGGHLHNYMYFAVAVHVESAVTVANGHMSVHL